MKIVRSRNGVAGTSGMIGSWAALFSLVAASAFSGCQHAQPVSSGPAASQVVVEFEHIDKFADFGDGPFGMPQAVEDHAAAFRRAAAQGARRYLKDGQTLKLTFTNIDLAGDHLPSMQLGSQSVRVLQDIYPPRIQLTFALTDANGAVIKQGERSLVDYAFMTAAKTSLDNALPHDLQLLRDWMRSEFRGS